MTSSGGGDITSRKIPGDIPLRHQQAIGVRTFVSLSVMVAQVASADCAPFAVAVTTNTEGLMTPLISYRPAAMVTLPRDAYGIAAVQNPLLYAA